MQILAGLIDVQRTSGQSAARARLGKGEDAVSTSMLTRQRAGKTYQEVETYCMVYAAPWLYMAIFLSARRPG